MIEFVKFLAIWYWSAQSFPKAERLELLDAILRFAFEDREPSAVLSPGAMHIYATARRAILSTWNRSNGQYNRQYNKLRKKRLSEIPPEIREQFASNSHEIREQFEQNSSELISKQEQNKTQSKTQNHDGCKSCDCNSHEIREQFASNSHEPAKTLPPSPIDSSKSLNPQDNKLSLPPAGAKRDKKTDFEDLIPERLRNDAGFRDEWRAWLDYRREKRKPVSKEAARRQLRLLSDYAPAEAIIIIENSIRNDWQGLFPERPTKTQPRRDYTGI